MLFKSELCTPKITQNMLISMIFIFIADCVKTGLADCLTECCQLFLNAFNCIGKFAKFRCEPLGMRRSSSQASAGSRTPPPPPPRPPAPRPPAPRRRSGRGRRTRTWTSRTSARRSASSARFPGAGGERGESPKFLAKCIKHFDKMIQCVEQSQMCRYRLVPIRVRFCQMC